MKKKTLFESETVALSLQVMYRMGGLRNALLYLLDTIKPVMSVSRINTLFAYSDASTIISMADTSAVSVSNKYRGTSFSKPLLLSDRMNEPLVVRDLTPYQSDPGVLNEPSWRDMPYLHFRSLLRLPLFVSSGNTFLINFWSDERDGFEIADAVSLRELLEPLVEELRGNFSDITLEGTRPAMQVLTGTEKLALCPGMMKVRQMVESVARCDSTVLVLGETGSGKEAVADAVHQLSARHSRPIIKVNCGAIPRDLIDSELFGHEKGAFTGASSSRPGYFEMADGGTLFLDEVGEMPPDSQVRLLRVLDSGMVRRVGGARVFHVDVRIVAATHDDLPRKVMDGHFRRDLWYRLAVFPIRIPPLRERLGDIPVLVRHFVQTKAHKLGLTTLPDIPEEELQALIHHKWMGNVRELEHVVERALIMSRMNSESRRLHFDLTDLEECGGGAVTREEVMPALRASGEWPTLRELEDRYIREVLTHCGGKLTGTDSATSVLDIHYTTLRSRMLHMGLLEDDEGPVSGKKTEPSSMMRKRRKAFGKKDAGN